jgi:hypothetical protein
MNYFYLNKKYIIYLLILFFIFINLTNIYYYYYTFREGFLRKLKKGVTEVVNTVEDTGVDFTQQAAEEAQRKKEQLEREAAEAKRKAEEELERQAAELERQAEEARRLAEKLEIQNALEKLIEPIINLKNIINNTLDFLKEF